MNLSPANLRKLKDAAELSLSLSQSMRPEDVRKACNEFVLELISLKRKWPKASFELLALETR